jgi:hypothetical protein
LNEAEIQLALISAMHPPSEARLVDFAALSTVEQVRLMARSKFMVGMQGAGMSNALFLPDTAVAFLLKPQHYQGNYSEGLLSSTRLDWACWTPPADEPKWTVLHPAMCHPNNELACIRDQDTRMDVAQLPDMLRRSAGPLSTRACRPLRRRCHGRPHLASKPASLTGHRRICWSCVEGDVCRRPTSPTNCRFDQRGHPCRLCRICRVVGWSVRGRFRREGLARGVPGGTSPTDRVGLHLRSRSRTF